MSYYGSDEWAVIESGIDSKIDLIQLGHWDTYEWSQFTTLKDSETDEIKWFDTEQEAIDFVLENFDKALISVELLSISKDIDGYYFS